MTDLTKIAVDAMGGDGSPKKIIDGIIHSHKSNKKNFFKIFGNKFQKSVEELMVSPTPNSVIIIGYCFGGVMRGLTTGTLLTDNP